MPKCCKGNGGGGCTYKSNVECDTTSDGNILEDAFKNYLTDMNQYDKDIIDNDEEEDDEDTIIETYTEGNLRG
jgi:hypothetical protein